MLEQSMAKFGLSARAYDRILKVARTIADLDAVTRNIPLQEAIRYPISRQHLFEAISFREKKGL